jgi:hypothetical protein
MAPQSFVMPRPFFGFLIINRGGRTS